jgi:hypothetical protein
MIDLESAKKLYEDDGTPLDKYQNTLHYIANAGETFGHTFSYPSDRWLVRTMNDDEAESIMLALIDEGWISARPASDGIGPFSLTAEGWRAGAEMASNTRKDSGSVFIAACFNNELKEAVETISNVVDGLGYKSRIVNRVPHNQIIDLMIYESIRESRFVVADLTCNRQSVYYEVGFAHGLGLEVILTCREDHLKDAEDESKRVHFDLNHRNILTWKQMTELSEKLRSHIYQCFGSIQPGD